MIAIGLVVAGWGVMVGIGADRALELPSGIESLTPVPDAVQVLSRSSIVADLDSGFTGVFVVNGTELETVNLDEIGSIAVEPGRQVDIPPVTVYEPGNSTLTFTPRPGAGVEEFATGRQEVTLIYWPLDEGRQRARQYTWYFEVF